MLVKKLTYHPIPYTWILILIIRMFIVMVGFTRRKFSHDQQDDQSKSLVHGLASLALVAFNAIIPLMTVVNYSVQETFGNNLFIWEGIRWFEEVMRSERFHDALGRQLLFTMLILLIEVPLGVGIALTMPRQGIGVTICLVLMALPLLIPWNVVGAMWNIFALPDIGLLGKMLNGIGFDYNFTQNPFWAWGTVVAMDV